MLPSTRHLVCPASCITDSINRTCTPVWLLLRAPGHCNPQEQGLPTRDMHTWWLPAKLWPNPGQLATQAGNGWGTHGGGHDDLMLGTLSQIHLCNPSAGSRPGHRRLGALSQMAVQPECKLQAVSPAAGCTLTDDCANPSAASRPGHRPNMVLEA